MDKVFAALFLAWLAIWVVFIDRDDRANRQR